MEVYAMGLFGSKKKEEAKGLPPLKFPELPKTVPKFEEQKPVNMGEAQVIKSAVSTQPRPTLPDTTGGPEKPLFVRIEKYRDVVETLKKLKGRLSDADSILDKLNHLKEEEERELASWHGDLEKIRNQLLDIDKKLFE